MRRGAHGVRGWTAAAAVVLLCACGGPEPTYRVDMGLTALAVQPGALAGVFGLRLFQPALIDVPILGRQKGGGETWYLVRRTWDPDAHSYTEEHQPCGGTIYDTGGSTKTQISTEARRACPASAIHTLEIDDAHGSYRVLRHLELWGVQDLPEPYDTPLPASVDESRKAPWPDLIVDSDGDGHPGLTAHVQSIVNGDQYFISRRVFTLDGVTLGPDRVVGLNTTDVEQATVGASASMLEANAVVRQAPDPLRSWFDEIRLPEGADCDVVQTQVDDGALGGTRPF
ncbi:MAG: hypothetical protein ACYC8T_21400 [Myxococcaceae bacterium]